MRGRPASEGYNKISYFSSPGSNARQADQRRILQDFLFFFAWLECAAGRPAKDITSFLWILRPAKVPNLAISEE